MLPFALFLGIPGNTILKFVGTFCVMNIGYFLTRYTILRFQTLYEAKINMEYEMHEIENYDEQL